MSDIPEGMTLELAWAMVGMLAAKAPTQQCPLLLSTESCHAHLDMEDGECGDAKCVAAWLTWAEAEARRTLAETSSTHLLGGFGASAEFDTDINGEGGR